MRINKNEEFDNLIKTRFFILKKNNNIRLNTNYKYFLNNELENYINSCFNDSFSFKESLYRIYYNINNHPKCKICNNNYCQFDIHEKTLFREYCKDKECIKKISNLKGKQTKKNKYGDENYNNRIKMKQTKLERYGNSNYNNSSLMKQTKLERYGDESYVNPNKAKQTKLEKYGSETYNNIDKTKQTCLKKYGAYSTLCKESNIRQNIKEANNKKYGFYYVNVEKCKQTKLERYGNENYNNKEKIQQTCIERFGYNTIFKVPEVSQRIANSEIRKQHEYETKKKNHSFKKSDTEDQSYILLKEKFEDVIRQYRSELYPFVCDFYIPSLDFYIECQYGQFHHHRPYLGTEQDLKDIEILKENANRIYKEKNVSVSRYDNELETWTIRDVNKRNIAKQNNLNYLEFWNINELKEWIKNL